MQKIHRTSDGRTILIAAMSDDHLVNTIRMYLRALSELRGIINGNAIIETCDEFTATILGIDEQEIIEDYKEAAVELTEKIMPYLLEATLRGIDLREDFQKAFGRTKAIGNGDRWLSIE